MSRSIDRVRFILCGREFLVMVMTIPAVNRILAMTSIEAPGESCQTNAYSLAMQYESVGVNRQYGAAARTAE